MCWKTTTATLAWNPIFANETDKETQSWTLVGDHPSVVAPKAGLVTYSDFLEYGKVCEEDLFFDGRCDIWMTLINDKTQKTRNKKTKTRTQKNIYCGNVLGISCNELLFWGVSDTKHIMDILVPVCETDWHRSRAGGHSSAKQGDNFVCFPWNLHVARSTCTISWPQQHFFCVRLFDARSLLRFRVRVETQKGEKSSQKVLYL